jgi:glycosyltransferase involved in cell wall biosynthesis
MPIQLHIEETALGPAAARNIGIQMSKGIWLYFLDADDLIPEGALDKHCEIMNTSKSDVLVGSYIKDANNLTFIIREEGCDEQEFAFKFRKFRWGALVGSVVGFTGTLGTVPFPFGTLVDLATGSLWKPNVFEKGISKENYKNYRYTLNYTGCSSINNFNLNEPNKQDIVLLKNGSIIKGQIVEMVPFEFLKLKISDDSIIILRSNEIERISKE